LYSFLGLYAGNAVMKPWTTALLLKDVETSLRPTQMALNLISRWCSIEEIQNVPASGMQLLYAELRCNYWIVELYNDIWTFSSLVPSF